jgi:alkylation response protein AidB-like acyl-CoA dehydrogenase
MNTVVTGPKAPDSFAAEALQLGGKSVEEVQRMGAVDAADERVDDLFGEKYQTHHSPVHRAVWDRHDVTREFDARSFPQETSDAAADVMRRSLECVLHHRTAGTLLDDQQKIAAHVTDELGRCGYWGLLIDREYGGSGASFSQFAAFLTQMAAIDPTVAGLASVHGCIGAVDPLETFGTRDQKRRLLPPLASGQRLSAFALTEPCAGSDLTALRTTAVRDGDDYVINGVKQFITSGKHGDVAIVMAVTDKAAGKRGISAFLVPTRTPGYRVARVEDKMGQHASDTAQIVFENCRIPARYRLGAEGDGYRTALSGLEGGRIGIASQSVGMARAAFEAALRYSKEREAFGQAIFQHQAVQFRLADMATRLEAARQLVLHAARLKDAGQPCLKEAAMAKLYASEVAESICSDAIQIHGGYGYLSDFPVERIYRDVRVAQIYEGTSDIQRILIGRALA